MKNKEDINQIPLFCQDGHDFDMAGDGYYKNAEDGNRITQVVYRMIFCLKCGINLEIIIANRTPKEEIKTRTTRRTRNNRKQK